MGRKVENASYKHSYLIAYKWKAKKMVNQELFDH